MFRRSKVISLLLKVVLILTPLLLVTGGWLVLQNKPWESATDRAQRLCSGCGLFCTESGVPNSLNGALATVHGREPILKTHSLNLEPPVSCDVAIIVVQVPKTDGSISTARREPSAIGMER